MKKFYPKFFFLLLPIAASAQLYVQPNPASTPDDEVYVYVKDEILFVEQEVNLQYDENALKEGNIYLRDEGQLRQGNSNSPNEGEGVISVFQEGIANQWDYQFWTSPVGDPLGTPIEPDPSFNTSNVTFNTDLGTSGGAIYYPKDGPNGIVSNIARYTNGYSGTYDGFDMLIANYWIYKYIAEDSYSGWQQVKSGGDINPGEGFTMKGLNEVGNPIAYDFRGRPNNGNISVEVKTDQTTLVGNPYPSAMNLSFYLLSNSGDANVANCGDGTYTPTPVGNTITGIAYFWESDPGVKSHYLTDYQGGYGAFSPLASCASPGDYTAASFSMYDRYGAPTGGGSSGDGTIKRHFAPVGQGFMVVGTADGSVTAKNEFRVYVKEKDGNSQFKSKDVVDKDNTKSLKLKPGSISYNKSGELIMPIFKIKIEINNQYTRHLTTALFDDATDGYDRAGDAMNISELDTDVNYLIAKDDNPYMINVLPYNVDKTLPLKINGGSSKNHFNVKVDDINFDIDGIWLHDLKTGEYFDILYSAHAFDLPKGTFNDRFEITFKNGSTENLGVAEDIKNSFDIFQNNKQAELQILNPLGNSLKEISVYDMAGRQMTSKINEGTAAQVTISSAKWSDGIYIVRVVTADNIEVSKKISVYNKN